VLASSLFAEIGYLAMSHLLASARRRSLLV